MDSSSRWDVVEAIAEFDRQVSKLSFGAIVRAALNFATEQFGLTRASVALLLPDGSAFRLYDVTLEMAGVESGKKIPFGSATLGASVRENRAIYRPDIRLWPERSAVDDALLAGGLLSSLTVPLYAGGRCTGTLNVAASSVDGIAADCRRILELVAPRLAFALEVGQAIDSRVESEARLRDVFDTVGDGVGVAELSSQTLVMVNEAFCSLLGYSREELLGSHVSRLHLPANFEKAMRALGGALRAESPHVLDVPFLRKDGSTVLVDCSVRRTQQMREPCVVGIFRDACGRHQRETEQVQLQKLESIRTLAAGLAHDFNNLLTGLVGNVSLAQELIEPGHELADLLNQAQGAATRATALTRQLLTFAKGGAPMRAKVSLKQLVRSVVAEFEGKDGLDLEVQLPDEDCLVAGDQGQLTQLLQNLLRNANESMANGGNAWVVLSKTVASGREEWCVEVRDSGCGIPSDQLAKVFLPFFTTKSRGNGLGLAVAYSIAQNHGGRIVVSSTLGCGTSFRVYLPPLTDASGGPRAISRRPVGTSRVLIMDDEAVVLEFAERALQRHGYIPVAVTNGQDAISAYGLALSQNQRFDVVILDLTVQGGMGGKDAAAQILALDPTALLVVSSGYSDDAVMSDFRTYGFTCILPKPYTTAQLWEAIAAARAEATAS